MEKKTVFISSNAIAEGIYPASIHKASAVFCKYLGREAWRGTDPSGLWQTYYEGDFHETREAALIDAERRRDEYIIYLLEEIERLKSLKF